MSTGTEQNPAIFGLSKPSWAELIAGVTLVSTSAAAVFNFGFFVPIQWSLISLLTVQDLITGASIAVPALMTAVALLMTTFYLLSLTHGRWRSAAVVIISLLIIALTVIAFLQDHHGKEQYILVAAFWAAITFTKLSQNEFSYKYSAPWFYSASVFLFFGFLGYIEGQKSITSEFSPDVVIKIEGNENPIAARLIRSSSAYLIIDEGHGIEVLPIDSISSILKPNFGRELND